MIVNNKNLRVLAIEQSAPYFEVQLTIFCNRILYGKIYCIYSIYYNLYL